MTSIRTRLSLLLAVTSAVAALVLAVPAQAARTQASGPYCGITWGSLPEVRSADDADMIVNLRAGRHACFDRLVFDMIGEGTTFDSYDVRYVPVTRLDGSGAPLPVRGDADLQIVLQARAHDGDGHATFTPANRNEAVNVTGFSTFRQVAWGGTYEGYTTVALGVRARLPFRVFTLDGVPQSDFGPRLVIDVAHRW